MDNTPYDDVFRTLLTDCTELKQLEAEYASIRERLEIACQMGDLNRYAKAAILDMSRKVIEHLAVKYKNVAKGVSRTMGGKVLNYEAKDILNRGRAEGRMEGRREGEASGIRIGEEVLTDYITSSINIRRRRLSVILFTKKIRRSEEHTSELQSR